MILVALTGLVLAQAASADALDRCLAGDPNFDRELNWTGVGKLGVDAPQHRIWLQPGEAIRVIADPQSKINIEQWGASSGEYGPMGKGVADGSFPVPGAPRYGLIGGPYHGYPHTFLYRGIDFCYQNTRETGGASTQPDDNFTLGINDNWIDDNQGGWRVTVRVYSVPRPPVVTPPRPTYRTISVFDPEFAMTKCRTGAAADKTEYQDLNGGDEWKPIRFMLQPGVVYKAVPINLLRNVLTRIDTGLGTTWVDRGDREWVPPSIRIGFWDWYPRYGPNGTGWSDLAPDDWPAPNVPKYGLIGAWEGLPGYYWVGGEAPCIQWTGSTPVTARLTMNDPWIGDNEGIWGFNILWFSPYK